MENTNISNKRTSNGVWGGAIIVLIGVIALLSNFDINTPHWLFEWHTFMLAIGLIIGFKRNFRGGGWLVLTIIGGIFTLDSILDIDYDLSRILFPAALIGLGAYLILRPKNGTCRSRRKSNYDVASGDVTGVPFEPTSKQDLLNSINVFGGSNQKVFSKNFQGGEVFAVFGGCDVDLTQADFSKEIYIEVTAIFGGCKIIVPPTWEVKSEITAIFGGVDDKRAIMLTHDATSKRIILRGLAMFGGVEIRSY